MVKMRGKRVGVEAPKKTNRNQGVFHIPDDNNAVGIVRYLGEDLKATDLKIGDKVYYGDARQKLTMEGTEILVMDESNILAVVEEAANEEDQAKLPA